MSVFININEHLSYGCQKTTTQRPENAVLIHACKEPCHRRAVGYSGKIKPHDPHYLAYEDANNLYLNLIDPPVPLFKHESFDIFFAFANKYLGERPIHIHCNQGSSRAPSLALLLMSKRMGLLPKDSFNSARKAFEEKHPYNPGAGITRFLEENWESLGNHP